MLMDWIPLKAVNGQLFFSLIWINSTVLASSLRFFLESYPKLAPKLTVTFLQITVTGIKMVFLNLSTTNKFQKGTFQKGLSSNFLSKRITLTQINGNLYPKGAFTLNKIVEF